MVFIVGPPPEPEPVPEPELEPDFLKLQPTRCTEVNARMAMKNGFIRGFISDRGLLSYLVNGWLYDSCNLNPSPRCILISHPRLWAASLIGMRAELRCEQLFHLVLVPFDNSI
jgi:hypothetical protein